MNEAPDAATVLALPPPSRDPVFAAVTPAGEGAIATLIIDGDGAVEALRGIFHSKQPLDAKQPGQLVLGRVVDAAGRMVDEAIAAPIPKEKSETGCEQVELSCHGGVGAQEAVREALAAAGIRAAAPHELIVRGHRAAKVSLPAIEARLRLARAATARQAEFLFSARAFQECWERHGLEAALGARERRTDWREGVHRAADNALAQAPAALALLRTHRVVLAGPVNAGKSTLANALLRAEASIVSALPGTTRDVLAREAALRGLSVELADTAGLREAAGDAVEAAGQALARNAAADADLVLIVLDGSRAPEPAELAAAEALAARPSLLVLNKGDLGTHAEAEGLAFAFGGALRVAARDGAGLTELEAALEAKLLGLASDADPAAQPAPGAPFTLRQRWWLEELKRGLQEGLDGGAVVGHIRNLVGTRPNEGELAAVFAERF